MKSKVNVSWRLTDDMKPNIKNYNDNYDKYKSLETFLNGTKLTENEIKEILSNDDPFGLANGKIKNSQMEWFKKGRYTQLDEFNLYNNIEYLKFNVIRNIDYKSLLNLLFDTFLLGIIYSSGFDYTRQGHNSESTYSYFINEISKGSPVINEDILICFQIIFYRSNKTISDFLNDFEWNWNNFNKTMYSKYINYVNGIEYVKGIFYKIIENSFNTSKPYNAKKIIK